MKYSIMICFKLLLIANQNIYYTHGSVMSLCLRFHNCNLII